MALKPRKRIWGPEPVSFSKKINRPFACVFVSRKGQGPPMWTYIVLATMLVVVSFLSQPLLESVEFQKANNARLEAQEIAGLINFAKTSDSYSLTYNKRLYQRDCTVEVNDRAVAVKIGSGSTQVNATVNVIQTPVRVQERQIDCRQNNNRLQIVKTGNLIEVK